MGKFNFKDYRQPWETGPHWELKREFMEKYSDMFPEDRLLCLAQAYSNIVLMHCSYPDPVMRQINLLSKPLEMRKKFQESNTTQSSKSQQQKEKRKSTYENCEKPCKLIKFCASEEQPKSVVPSNSTILHENVLKQSSYAPVYSSDISTADSLSVTQSQSETNSTVKDIDQNQISAVSCNDQIKDKRDEIVDILGLEFIQNFAQEIRNFQSKLHSAAESILNAAQRLKIYSKVCFKIDSVPDCPMHTPVFYCELTINNCVIASEQGGSKKKAKAKCAESALDILIKISGVNTHEKTVNKINTVPTLSNSDSFVCHQSLKEEKCMDVYCSSDNPSVNYTKKLNSEALIDDMKMLQIFSEKIASRTKHENSVGELMFIAKKLNLYHYVTFDITAHSNSPQVSKYNCKFYFKNILISVGKDTNVKSAKTRAVEYGFTKLQNLPKYEIQSGKLVEKQISVDMASNSVSLDSVKKTFNYCNFQKSSFILNKKMFDSSRRDGFVLLDNLSFKSIPLKNFRSMISESASFCRKPLEYQFEEISGRIPPAKMAQLRIAGEVVATGVALTKDDAKIIACAQAIEILRKKYYTLKVKNEYNDGYIINRNQVLEGESFSSNALTENNIGCKMLKNMGWTGGGLGSSGIAEPVEAQGHHSFGRGLGYGNERSNIELFKRRIESMLQDYSKTDTLSDLVFSKEFTKDERKEIHKIARKYNLHTASRGINEERFLTVRHKYTVTQILSYLEKNGGSNSKFELVDGTSKPFEI